MEKFEILKVQNEIVFISEKCYHFCGAVLRYANKIFFPNSMKNSCLGSRNVHDKVRIKLFVW